MNSQKDLDSVNNELYCIDVPNEAIKKIMFYFMVLKEVIGFSFPENYINYQHPYFTSYEEMEDFFALSRSLNPDFLHQKNVIIYHNDKTFYKYYQLNDDQDGIPYEFKVVDIQESTNPIFNDNYQNSFNISNINKEQKEFSIKLQNKSNLLHTNENTIDSIEENYFNDGEKINKINLKKNKKSKKSIFHKNKMNSENEDDFNIEEFYLENIQIKNRLIVTKDWIDFIYNETQRELLPDMKIAIKKDDIRTKSIKLAKNAFYYLEILMIVILAACSLTLFSMCSSLKSDERFKKYKGNYDINNNIQKSSSNLLNEKTVYENDTIIIPEKNKYNKINKACQFGITSAVFAIIFVIFLIYMCIRVAREKRKKYQKQEKAKKAGLNLCHFIVFIFLTLLAFILTLVAEIYIAIAISQRTYKFIHNMVRNQLIVNSLLFFCYLLIIVFYCKI